MSNTTPVLKDEKAQQPVPSAWRSTLVFVVEAFKEGDFTLRNGISGVRAISLYDAKLITDNIKDYGAQLVSLPEKAWETSVCQWMQGYWVVLVDLFTAEEGASDLVLSVRVYEENGTYAFDIQSVYVP
jgi:hypothetical protein